eukprot:6071809-Prymnesium_polylepis.1
MTEPGLAVANDCGVALQQQLSSHRSPCRADVTFGCAAAGDATAMWVSKGCRGEFQCGGLE